MPPRPSCATMRYFPIILSIMGPTCSCAGIGGEFNCMLHRAGCQCEKPCNRCDIITNVTRCLPLLVACLMMVACSQPSPAPTTGSSGPQRITGAERIAWDQQAGSTDELA